MTIAKLALLATLLAAAVAPSLARAQAVEAEVLFRDGKKLIKEGKLAAGCDKLDASARIESSVGTLLNLGDCRDKLGQHATAWAVFQKAAAAAKVANDGKREAEARRREKLLEAKLSYVTISVPDANKLPGLTITRNGTAVDPALWNASVPVDPGDYDIAASATGHGHFFDKRLHVDAGGHHASVEVAAPPNIEPVATKPEPVTPKAEPKSVAQTEPTGAVATPEPERTRDAPSTFTGTRKLAIAVGIVGLASIGAGVYFGLHANDLEQQSDALCPTAACTDPMGVSLNSDARSAGTTATITIAVGGAAVAGAAVLWFVGAPKVAHEDVAVLPAVTGDRIGLTLAGRF